LNTLRKKLAGYMKLSSSGTTTTALPLKDQVENIRAGIEREQSMDNKIKALATLLKKASVEDQKVFLDKIHPYDTQELGWPQKILAKLKEEENPKLELKNFIKNLNTEINGTLNYQRDGGR
jgi:hypothetical protein